MDNILLTRLTWARKKKRHKELGEKRGGSWGKEGKFFTSILSKKNSD